MAAVWKLWKNPKTQLWERTFAVLTGEPNELMAPIHDRMTTFLEPRDYTEYLAPTERPPLHLLRILPSDKMRATLVGETPVTNQQVSLFDSQ
jgi:putative SOS response-associated peptidase YedK